MKSIKKVIFAYMIFMTAASFSSCRKEKSVKLKEKDMNKKIEEAVRQEQKLVTDFHAIPSEYKVKAENGGKILNIEYKSRKYYGDGSENIKKANIYLPKDYENEKANGKKYSVLYLMHGIGGNENEWGMTDENSLIKKIMDNLIERKEITPFIVITPNGKSGENKEQPEQSYMAFYDFGKELRNDLIPFIDSNFATIADRNHRAMAGLSMGGMQTINIGICECLDLFSWYGAFSAAPTSYEASKIASWVNNNPENTINYFYNICGKQDSIAYNSHANASRLLPKLSPKFVEGENYTWHEQMGGHDFGIWNLGFYEFARIFGSNSSKSFEELEADCPSEFTKLTAGVKYGKILHEKYNSTTCKMERKFNVLLPASYKAENTSKKYPVLYLLHGIFGDENALINDYNNHLNEIFSNLAEKKQAKEMIVVFPDMYATTDLSIKPAFDQKSCEPYDNFINDLVTDLMPCIESKYNVKTGRNNTAICGFSLGGRESLFISLQRPDLFSYAGAIAPAPGLVHTRDWAMEHTGQMKEDDVKFADSSRPHVLMICAGDSDKVVGLYPKSYHELLKKNGTEHIWYELKNADHDSRIIRSGIYHFASLIFQ